MTAQAFTEPLCKVCHHPERYHTTLGNPNGPCFELDCPCRRYEGAK